MAKVLMTGMCSIQDRTAYHSEPKRVHFRPWPPAVKSYDDFMEQCRIASNTGNYLITEGAYRALTGHSVDYHPFWHILRQIDNTEFIDFISSEYQFVLFVTANILNIDFDLTNEVKVLQALRLPKIFMSIGVQSVSDLKSGLHESGKLFIDQLRQDSSHVFTRGAYAAKFLRTQGVKNIYEVSCPSSFNYADKVLTGVKALKSIDRTQLRDVWVNGYIGDGGAPANEEITTFGKVAKRLGYVFQDEALLFGILDKLRSLPDIYDDASGKVTGKPTWQSKEHNYLIDYYAFFSPDQWRALASTVDLLVGRRFHGNLIGLQAGKPAFFIAHDDRVREMLNGVGLPFVEPKAWSAAEDKLAFFERFVKNIEYAKFQDKYLSTKDLFHASIRSIIG